VDKFAHWIMRPRKWINFPSLALRVLLSQWGEKVERSRARGNRLS
jgi:hypothetical protein